MIKLVRSLALLIFFFIGQIAVASSCNFKEEIIYPDGDLPQKYGAHPAVFHA